MKRRVFLSFGAGLCTLLTLAPGVSAQSFWLDLHSLFAESYADVQTYLNDIIDDTYGELAPYVKPAVTQALGQLGLSDPLIVDQEIRDRVIGASGPLDLGQPPAVVLAESVAREVDRQRLRSHSASVIGQEGQQAIAAKLEQTSVTLEETTELGFIAQDALSTQEAIKAMALQNTRNTELIGALQAEVVNSRIDEQFQAEVLSNISQTLDEQRTIQQNRDLAGVATSLSLAAQSGLF